MTVLLTFPENIFKYPSLDEVSKSAFKDITLKIPENKYY